VTDITRVLEAIPLLPWIGLAVVLLVVLAPAALALAGLTGAQIVELLRLTMQFVIDLIKVFRDRNQQPPSKG